MGVLKYIKQHWPKVDSVDEELTIVESLFKESELAKIEGNFSKAKELEVEARDILRKAKNDLRVEMSWMRRMFDGIKRRYPGSKIKSVPSHWKRSSRSN